MLRSKKKVRPHFKGNIYNTRGKHSKKDVTCKGAEKIVTKVEDDNYLIMDYKTAYFVSKVELLMALVDKDQRGQCVLYSVVFTLSPPQPPRPCLGPTCHLS
jgi:hypothetical protein